MLPLCLVLVLCILAVISAQLQHPHLNSHFNQIIQNKAKVAIETTRSLGAVYHATNILSNIYSINDYQCHCNEILKQLGDGYSKSSYEVFYGVESANLCNCPYKLHDDIISKLEADLKKGDMRSFAGAALALKTLNKPIPTEEILNFINPLEVDGYYKTVESNEDNEANIENTKYVLQVLAAYSTDKKEFKDLVEKFLPLIPEGDDSNVVDSGLLADIMKIAEKKPKLSSKRLLKNAEILLQESQAEKLCVVLKALRSLQAVNDFKIAPIDVDMDKTSFAVTDSKKSIGLTVVNAFGQPAKVTNIQVKSVKRGKDSESKFSSEKLEESTLDLSNLDLVAGKYEIVFAISVEDRSAAVEIKKTITIRDELSLVSLSAAVTNSKSTAVSDLKSFETIDNLSADAANSDYIHIAFTLQSKSSSKLSKPQQSFVRFFNRETGVESFFSAKLLKGKSDNSGSVFKTVIPVHENVATFEYTSGKYEVSIIVADASIAGGINQKVGFVEIGLPKKPSGDGPLYSKSLLHTSDNTLTALPEIEHQMRPPAKRASPVTSTAFTSFVGATLVFFIIYVLTTKPNFKKADRLMSLLFMGVVGTVLLMYIGYWFSVKGLSFYETLYYMLIMLPLTYFIGRRALSNLIAERSETKSKNE